jgi:hypothetical protein
MIGIRQLSKDRMELYASQCPLDALKPYLLDFYREAYVTIVLYEDNNEVYHETGIFSFDASEPETFNYEEFRAPLIEEFHDRLAICTVENLFLHLERYMEEKPMEDDPFRNIVFSISLAPPSRDVLLDWEKNIDKRLRRVLYDDKSTEHFQLFPEEVCVVYSHGNHFTSVTSERENLIQAIFEDVVERHLAPICEPPLAPGLITALYRHLTTYNIIRLKADRLHTDEAGQPYMLVTYPRQSKGMKKPFSRIILSETGVPLSLSEPEETTRFRYHLRYSDMSLLPMILVVSFMSFVILGALFLRMVFPSHTL